MTEALRGRLLGVAALVGVTAVAVFGLLAMTGDAGGETDDGHLVRWTFDEGSGDVIAPSSDSSAPVNLQVIGEPVWTDGAIGIGTTSYLVSEGAVTALADAVATARELTFELWIDPYSTDQLPLSTIATLADGRSTDMMLLANPTEDSDGAVLARIRSALTDTVGRPGAEGGDGTLTGGLTHIVVVHAGRTIELFVDGESIAQTQVGPMVGPSAAARLSFGAAVDGSSTFAADLHEVSVYSYALNPGEIQSRSQAGPAGVEDVSAVDVQIETQPDDTAIDPSATVVDIDDDGVVAGVVLTGSDGDATIEIWHGTQGSFGRLGSVQPQLNVIGLADDPEGVREVRFTLPGSDERILAGSGPNGRRLVTPGSFNLEIPDVLVGPATSINVFVIDNTGDQTTITVPLADIDGAVGRLPLTLDWTEYEVADEAVDVVDGRWRIAGDDLVNDELGYDRLVGIGDNSWQDYEVLVPIEVTRVSDVVGPNSNSPGVGVIMRWNGHNRSAPGSSIVEQPLEGFRAFQNQVTPFGTIAWFRFSDSVRGTGRSQLVDHENTVRANDAGRMRPGVLHWLRVSVVTNSPGRSTYRMKLWAGDTREPEQWEIEFTTNGTDLEPSQGALALVSHEVEARFGTVTVNVPGASPPIMAEPTSDALAEWGFEEGFGPTAFDLTGNGFHLSAPTSATWVDGGLLYSGQAGSLSALATDIVDRVLDTQEFSVELWADPNGLEQATFARLFSIQGAAGALDIGTNPLTGATDQIEVRVRTEETDFLGRPGRQVGGVNDGGLRHIVVTQAGGITSVYVDGVLVDSNETGLPADWDQSARISIAGLTAGDAGWSGTMLHSAIWARSLPQDEIAARFEAGPGVTPP